MIDVSGTDIRLDQGLRGPAGELVPRPVTMRSLLCRADGAEWTTDRSLVVIAPPTVIIGSPFEKGTDQLFDLGRIDDGELDSATCSAKSRPISGLPRDLKL